MNCNRSSIFCGLFLSTVVQLGFVIGLQTENCNLQQLEDKSKAAFSCWYEHGMSTFFADEQTTKSIALGCDYVDVDVSCFTENLGSCFSDEMAKDLVTVMEYSYANLSYVSCNRFEGARKAQMETKLRTIMEKYVLKLQTGNFIDSIIQFDNKCSTEKFFQSFSQYAPCLENSVQKYLVPIAEAFTYTVMGQNTSMPVCEGLSQTLFCITPNNCLSKREADFLQDLIATFYDVFMKVTSQIQEKFGSIVNVASSIRQRTGDPTFANSYTEEEQQAVEIMFQWLVHDYKSQDCKIYLTKFEMFTSDDDSNRIDDGEINPTIQLIDG
jgi:hypothetical protein